MRGSLRDEFNLLIKLIVSIQIRPVAENKNPLSEITTPVENRDSIFA